MSLHRSWAAALAALLALAVLLRTSAEDDNGGSPILARVSKDASTSLYTIAIKMASSMPTAADSPAVIFGGHQMENNLLMFDLVKETFAFSGLLLGIRTTCSNFNFTMGSY
uniref:Xylanase inhibitor C-terminal domain-containing protein n=1 Tax=Aegilops tauschii TaxID=37682 RepID=M8C738_AEGTA